MNRRLLWGFVILLGFLEFINILNFFPVSRYGTIIVDFDNIVGLALVGFGGFEYSKMKGR